MGKSPLVVIMNHGDGRGDGGVGGGVDAIGKDDLWHQL